MGFVRLRMPPALGLALFGILLTNVASAAERRATVLSRSEWDRVYPAAQQEAEAFEPATSTSVEQARHKFVQSWKTFDAQLSRKTTNLHWRRFLQWTRAAKLLSDETSAEQIAIVYPYWEQASRSWNEPALAATTQAMRDWSVQLARFAQGETSDRFRDRLVEIESTWRRWQAQHDEIDWQHLNRLTHALYQMGEAPELTRFLRQQCSRPNLRILADAGWIARTTYRPIDETFPVYDQTDRSVASGTGQLTGQAQLEPVASEQGGRLAIVFRAQALAEVEGGVPGVRAGFVSRSSTNIEGFKPLNLAGNGLSAGPAQVSAQSNIECLSVQRGIGLIPRFAERGIYNGTAEAEERASSRARQQSVERLDAVARELQEQTIAQHEHPAIQEFIAFAPGVSRSWRTTSDKLEGWLWRTGPSLFAGPSLPPLPTTRGAVVVQAHETYLDRSFQERWGNKVVTFEEIGEAIQKGLGKEMEPLDIEPGWSLRTAAEPTHIRLEENCAKVALRFEKFQSPTGEFPGLAIAVQYRLDARGGELYLHRDAEIEVTPLALAGEARPLTGRMLVLTRIVRRNFDELLPRQIPIKALQIGRGASASRPLRFEETTAEQGWLTTVLNDRQGPITAGRQPQLKQAR